MNGRNAVVWLNFLVVLVVSSAAICRELPRENPTWEDLVQLLDEAPGGLALISGPFTLTNCGNEFREYLVERNRALDVVCCNGDCIIDCPLVQFRVSSNATLTFELLTLQNTIRSTVVVETNGTLISRSTRFLNNQVAGDGGSILAMADSRVEVSRGRFENNIASNGGAIYTQGSLVLEQVSFWNNQAIRLGGAVYGGILASATITRSTFGMNSAAEGGPAVFCNAPTVDWALTLNKGCMNVIDNGRTTCDGVEWLRAACFPFSGSACDTPTATPTLSGNESGILASPPDDSSPSLSTVSPTFAVNSTNATGILKKETTAPSFLSASPTLSPNQTVNNGFNWSIAVGPDVIGNETLPPSSEQPTAEVAD